MTNTRVRLGSRGSPLALAQAEETKARLSAAHPDLAAPGAIEIVVIKTTGDRIQDRPLSEAGGKGLFTKEIEEALLAGSIDAAVHSMKDVPTWLPDELEIPCILPREDPRDALFLRGEGTGLSALAAGAVVGTASLRRQALLLLARPDLRVVSFRGNVGTRLQKLKDGAVDATLLAMAGLRRLGAQAQPSAVLEPEEMLPAVAQGAIGIEIRSADARMRKLLAALHDAASGVRVAAERACLAALDGSCRTPIAAFATLAGDRIFLRALVAKPDGSHAVRGERRGAAADATALGGDLGQELLRRAGPSYLAP
ncbi:MAG: hydroxymethylbilane synthase [Alphaproteobacteria bacterium]|nr:hydroxymethylbilane synthase [Alphaproteobacteria bacterium]